MYTGNFFQDMRPSAQLVKVTAAFMWAPAVWANVLYEREKKPTAIINNTESNNNIIKQAFMKYTHLILMRTQQGRDYHHHFTIKEKEVK